MAIHIYYDQKRNTRHYSLIGEISYNEIINVLKEVCKDPDHKSAMKVLWDLTDASFVNITAEEVRQIATLVGEKWGNSPISKAALVAERVFDYGMSRMYAIYLENKTSCKVEVFRGVEEALAWLGARSGTSQSGYTVISAER